MNQEITLPNSQHINIDLGLKYLNGNRKLYLKVLNSFLTRYQNFDINKVNHENFKNEMHTLKGLSSTLGMQELSTLSRELEEKKLEEKFSKFSKLLTSIINDLA